MEQPAFDPGLSQQLTARLRRSINPDGSFNVHRRGVSNHDVYKALINTTWPKFITIVLGAFLLTNTLFAAVYLALGIEHLKGSQIDSMTDEYASAFFFSVHTLTTVGYGSVYPEGIPTNIVSSLEAMTGLLGFALATGLLYGRFSRPSARILFSKTMIVAPYQEGAALMFRVANLRTNVLMEIEATMMLTMVEEGSTTAKRSYAVLSLERRKIYFLPLTWTVVHPIDESSPLYGKTAEHLARAEAEILILIKAFDDTFSQTVHARYSYRFDEILWGAKFPQVFEIDSAGDVVLHLDRLSDTVPAEVRGIGA